MWGVRQASGRRKLTASVKGTDVVRGSVLQRSLVSRQDAASAVALRGLPDGVAHPLDAGPLTAIPGRADLPYVAQIPRVIQL